jgi:two-component system sensor kinase
LQFTTADSVTTLPVPEGRVFAERYRIVRFLKRGQGIDTLLGTDLLQNQSVIVKTARGAALSPGAQMRLEHEAEVLRRIRSFWIAPLLDVGREGDLLFVVMGFVPGHTLATRLRHGPLSIRETITLGSCLMMGLQEAHDQGVLHRDLKPANIIVDDESPLERATIIDFGLARSARLDASLRDQPVGTARYMAPEQAGLLDQDTDERSDLYSAGVVLFECLAGQPPFQATSVGEVLRQHMTVRPPELRSLGLAVPRTLDEIIQRLLRKDPRDRFQSAMAVLADFTQLVNALDQGIADPALVVGLRDRRRSLTEPAFVGRDEELAALDHRLELARQGNGGLVLLEAESGGGKTRLLVELAQRSGREGAWVLKGQGLDQEAVRPFQVLAGVAAEIVAASRRDGAVARSIQDRLGDQRAAVCAALPELTEILGGPTSQILGPETFGELRSLQSLAALLDALGSTDRPALVLLDDCQWADELTLKLVAHWQRRQAEKGGHVLVVIAFRSEEVPAGHWLRSFRTALHLNLPPFASKDVHRLAESMAGPLPSEAVVVLERLSEGSPFMAVAVLQGLVESGALVAEATGWRVEPLAMADVQSSRHAAAFLAHRIAILPQDVLQLLSAGAVLGKEFDLESAATLANQSPVQAIAAIDEARRRHVIWARSQQTRCAFVHDKLRQTLLERLQPTDRQDLHRRTALYLEKLDTHRLFELAYHFDAAGQSDRALPYALAAAEKARSQHSLEIAEQQYEIAARGVAAEDSATRFRVAEGLGDVFMLRGRYDQAARHFESARALAQGDVAQAEIEGKLGELAFKRGDIKNASTRVEHALRLLRRNVPRWSLTFYLLVVWEVVVQALHTWLPWLFLGRRALREPATELLPLRLYSRLAHLYWFHRGTVPSLWAHLRGLNRAERYPPTPELAQAYSEHAPGMSLIGFFRRGIAYAEKSLVIRKALGDLWGQGQSYHFYGVVLYASSRFQECIEKCRLAIRLLERTGDYWEVHIARYQIAASLYRLGDLAGAVDEARRMYQSGLELGDAQASGISLDIWARASLGQLPRDIIDVELGRATGDVQRAAQVLLAKGVWLYYHGDPGAAAQVFGHAQQLVRNAGVKNAWVAPLLPWLATARRRQAELTPDQTPWRRRALLRRARSAARQGLRVARKFQNELPHAMREAGLLCAIQGRGRRARRWLNASLAVADRQGALHERAQTLWARGRVGSELGWANADQDLAEANRELAALESGARSKGLDREIGSLQPVTLSLADRFDTLLDSGRRIASALSRAAVFQGVREAAMKLLRCERCLVLKVAGEGGQEDITTVSGEIEADYSRTMARRALAAGRAVAVLEGRPDQASESALLSGVRSALCAPILVRGRVAGCFYVTHRQVAGLFGEEEERLADFIAALAGAALENAEGFAELRRLNTTLELQFAESKRAADRIREQAALLDKARDAIAVVDLEDRILFWNQSSERLYGWTAAEALGKKAGELLMDEASVLREETVRTFLERGEWSGELPQVTKCGKAIVVESRWTLVRDEAGRPKSRLVVNTDITEKKKLEAQFLRSQRMESLGTLAGGIAHDINNVLTPIMMAVDLLKLDLPEDQRRALLADLQTGALRGADMVKQILSFARGVDGKRVPLQLKHVVHEVEKMLQRTLPKSIDIRTAMAKDLWVVVGDPTQLHQMLMNLCVNARDAMHQGGILSLAAANVVLKDTDVQTVPNGKPGPHVLLTVEDTGTGIAPDALERIFDPFFTTKEFGKGSGLGLSTVLGIVKGHGGFVSVSSKEGIGTQFSIYLPAREVAVSAASEEKREALPQGNGEMVLVVDDEASILQLIRLNLEAHGYKVLSARDGVEAADLCARHGQEIRVVLTDMAMPHMDGRTLIQMLKRTSPRVRVIAASGLNVSLETALAGGASFNASLHKPFTAGQLLSCVHDVLRDQGPVRS